MAYELEEDFLLPLCRLYKEKGWEMPDLKMYSRSLYEEITGKKVEVKWYIDPFTNFKGDISVVNIAIAFMWTILMIWGVVHKVGG